MRIFLILILLGTLSFQTARADDTNLLAKTRIRAMVKIDDLPEGFEKYLNDNPSAAEEVLEPMLTSTEPEIRLRGFTCLVKIRSVGKKHILNGFNSEFEDLREAALVQGLAEYPDLPELGQHLVESMTKTNRSKADWMYQARYVDFRTYAKPVQDSLRRLLEQLTTSAQAYDRGVGLISLAKFQDEPSRDLLKAAAAKEPLEISCGSRSNQNASLSLNVALAMFDDKDAVERISASLADRLCLIELVPAFDLSGKRLSRNRDIIRSLVNRMPVLTPDKEHRLDQYLLAHALAGCLGVTVTLGENRPETDADYLRLRSYALQQINRDTPAK